MEDGSRLRRIRYLMTFLMEILGIFECKISLVQLDICLAEFLVSRHCWENIFVQNLKNFPIPPPVRGGCYVRFYTGMQTKQAEAPHGCHIQSTRLLRVGQGAIKTWQAELTRLIWRTKSQREKLASSTPCFTAKQQKLLLWTLYAVQIYLLIHLGGGAAMSYFLGTRKPGPYFTQSVYKTRDCQLPAGNHIPPYSLTKFRAQQFVVHSMKGHQSRS